MSKLGELEATIACTWAPPPKWKVSQWADNRRKLSGEAAAEKGQWRTSRAEYQRDPMDSINDPSVKRTVLMTSAQVGKTEILLNAIGFFIDFDASPIMLVQPTQQMCEAFSKDRVAPMIRDTPSIRKKVADPRSRDSGNTTLHKRFAGGHLTIAGAESPVSLAMRPIRVALLDEVDRYKMTSEGDPVSLAVKRTNNFWNRHVMLASSPTVKGFSRIEKEWEKSDKRFFYVPCPHCGTPHVLRWGNVVWGEQTPAGGDPAKAVLQCPHCQGYITNAQKNLAVAACRPLPDGSKPIGNDGKPLGFRATAPFDGIAGFHVWEAYSPWRTLAEIVSDFLAAKNDPSLLQVWVNTCLGEPWEDAGESVHEHELIERCEPYAAEVPARALVLTAGVDTQPDRLEVEVVGWAGGEESWSIDHHVIRGDPDLPEGTLGSPWTDLTDYLRKRWKHESGIEVSIEATCVDTGGSNTSSVYEYVKRHRGDRVFGIKGKGGDGIPIVGNPMRKRSGKKTKRPIDLYTVGVDQAKMLIMRRLKITSPGPGYCHFPANRDPEFFRQLTAEKLITKFVKGYPKRTWEKPSNARNEALDCRVYAFAALVLRAPQFDKLALRRLQTMPAPKPAEVETPPPTELPAEDTPRPDAENAAKRKRTTRRASFVHSW